MPKSFSDSGLLNSTSLVALTSRNPWKAVKRLDKSENIKLISKEQIHFAIPVFPLLAGGCSNRREEEFHDLAFSSKHVHADAQPTLSPFSHLHTYTSNIQHTHSVLSFHPSLIQHPHPLTRHTRFPNLLIGWWQRAVGLEPYICSLQTNLSLEQKLYILGWARTQPDILKSTGSTPRYNSTFLIDDDNDDDDCSGYLLTP